MKNCTLLVLSCDKYSDAWVPFFTLLKRYWGGGDTSQLKIVLMAEEKTFSFEDLNIISFPTQKKEAWSERLIRYLDHIETDFVMIACEDSFLREKNDPVRIERFISYMEQNPDISNIALQGIDLEEYPREDDGRFPELDKRPHGSNYCFNTGGIWRVKHLRNYLVPEESPWDFETVGNYRSRFTKNTFYAEKKGNFACWPINWSTDWMGIMRGKWVIDDVKPLFEKEHIAVDFSKLGIYSRPKQEAAKIKKEPGIGKRIYHAIRRATWKKLGKMIKESKKIRHAYKQVVEKKKRGEWP